MNNLLVSIQKLEHSQDLPLPFYATLHSAGMDLMAALGESVVIVLEPMQRALIPTGIAIALPIGYEAQVRPRSGLAFKHGITVANAPGTIDSDYRGEIFVPLINFSQDSFKVAHGMRIAQLVIAKHERVNWNLAKSLEESARGDGGFGSTGV